MVEFLLKSAEVCGGIIFNRYAVASTFLLYQIVCNVCGAWGTWFISCVS